MLVLLTACVVIGNVALAAPCDTVTVPGTENALLALESETTAPPAGAPDVSVTVPVEGFPPTTGFGLALTDVSAAAPDGGGFHPSCTTSKSLAFSVANAGFSTSLFQRVSNVPEMYMSEPLSATINPYFCIARKILRELGSVVRVAGS